MSFIRAFGGGLAAIISVVMTLDYTLASASATTASEQKAAQDKPRIEAGINEYSSLPERPHMVSAFTLKELSTTADHSKFKELQGPFSSGPEVTKACLSCHNKAGEQLRGNVHWTWDYTHPVTGQKLGKGRLINNFCTNARGNEGMCAQCHAGFGRASPDYDLSKLENIDCLACHDSTGKYYKLPPTRGNKACAEMFEGKKPIDWVKTAQNVKMPGRNNCGMCHFYGGGGDNVKHGDLSSVLFDPPKDVDVHMSKDGAKLVCIDCHVGMGHKWAGSRYQMTVGDAGKRPPGAPREKATCTSCHTDSPHSSASIIGIKLNGHVDKVACESCHIPAFARGGVATKVFWDWRTAGRLKDGKGYREEGYVQGDGKPRHTYKSIKGSFKYGENIRPAYRWFNGVMRYTTIETKFDPSKPVEINSFSGSYDDPKSRIYPFKKMRTMQPYDKGNNTLVYMHLWGDDKDAFWGNYDLARAIARGMKDNGIPYSGKYGFIETWSWWPINHMVAPKEKAVQCDECHTRDNGRLAKLAGFYMPGRDRWWWLDLLGWLAIFGALALVIVHTIARIVMKDRYGATGGKE